MNNRAVIMIAFTVFLAGCQKPSEVQLTDESPLELQDVLDPDESFNRNAVDTTALLPREQQTFAGFVTLTHARSDFGSLSRNKVIARVVVEDKRRFITVDGRRLFVSFPLGVVRFNGMPLLPRDRRLGGQSAGFEYVREVTDYDPGQLYTFSADSLGSLAVRAPELVAVESPVSGTSVRRDRDLPLRWRGRGDLRIIISAVTITGQTHINTRPLLGLRPRQNLGHVLLPKRILGGLPPGNYVFTFVIANRDVRQLPVRYGGTMLIQASSIHNVMVELR